MKSEVYINYIQTYTNIYKGIQMEREKRDFRVLRIRYDELEPTELIAGILKYFKDFDIVEVQRRGKEISVLGMTEDRLSQEMTEWGKTIGL
jgi:hypothetical protein